MSSFKNRLRYRYEQYLAKGGSSIFLSLLIVFLTVFVLIVLLRLLIIYLHPDYGYQTGAKHEHWYDHVWTTFLQMTAAGNMNQDSGSNHFVTRIATVLAGFSGLILLSMLIAFITTSLNKMLYEFRKGRGPVIEEEHTLILGWNDRIFDILRELILANESEKRGCVVILADEEKEHMDDLIVNRIKDPMTTVIVTSSGDVANTKELERVNAMEAKSVIILAQCAESAKNEVKLLSDTQTIKQIMALVAVQGGENKIPIIAEVFNEEKRQIIEYFDDEQIIALDSWDIMGKLLVQTALTSGLEMVYAEILSFDLSEIYFYEAEWHGVLFDNLAYHFKDGIPLGIMRKSGELMLRPEMGTALEEGDEIVILAEDDSTIDYQKEQLFFPQEIPFSGVRLEPTSKRVLILGWHSVGQIFVSESNDYLEPGSHFDVVMANPSDEIITEINDLDVEYPDIDIDLHKVTPLSKENLLGFKPFSYDYIVILSQEANEQSAEKIDSDTLMILLLLRKIAKELEISSDQHTKIITQVLNSDNQDLIIQTDVDDFIISNKLITMILAQLSEQPRIKKFYDDIFQEDGSEIYVKASDLYFTELPQTIKFADAIRIAQKRDEICLGIRRGELSKNPEENFGVQLNIEKDATITITDNDFLVVLAEDEL